MAISEQRKAELQALIATHKAKTALPEPVIGLTPERRTQLDSIIAKQKATPAEPAPVPAPVFSESAISTIQEAGQSFIEKETARLKALAGAAGDVFSGKIPVTEVGGIIKGQIAGVVNDLAGEFVSGVGSLWFKQQPKETQDAVTAGIQSVADTKILGTEATVKDSVAKLITTYQTWAEKHPDQAIRAESIANVLSLVPLGAVSEAVGVAARRVAAETIIATGGTAKYIAPAFGGKVVEGAVAKEAAQAAVKTGKGVIGETLSGAKRTLEAIPGRIEANRAALEASRKMLEPLPLVEREAITNGVLPRDVSLYRDLSPTEKTIARSMISHAEQFGVSRAAKDPAEIVGHEVTRRLDSISTLAEQRGKKLGELVSLFPSTDLSRPSIPAVIARLREVNGLRGLVVSPEGELDFTRTVLAAKLSASEQRTVASAFSDMFGMDAEQLHLYRQQLFDVLDGKGKAGLILNGVEERALNAIRRGIADVLDASVPGYKALNQQNAELLGLLSRYKKFFRGLDVAPIDIKDARGAVLARRLTSHAPSSQDLSLLFKQTEDVLAKYGVTFDVNINNLQDVLNAIERYFDITKDTGLAGQIKVGVGDVMDSLTGMAINKAKQFGGVTSDVTRSSFKKLFDELLEGGEKGDNKANTPNNPVNNNEGGSKVDHSLTKDTTPMAENNQEEAFPELAKQRAANEADTKELKRATLSGEREYMRLDNKDVLKSMEDIIGENAKPNDPIIIYRASAREISPGDQITILQKNAERYIPQRKGSKLQKKEVKLTDLVRSEGLRSEFIYAPKNSIK